MIPVIRIEDYKYPLTDDRIAKYPLDERDSSKLLVYKNGAISESVFKNLAEYLPEDSLMVFNDTKVVPARLHFQRSTGAHIEIFCLEPVEPSEYNNAFQATERCSWKCVVGNVKRWKDDILHLYNPENSPSVDAIGLEARLLSRDERTGMVEFLWKDGSPFSRVLEACGTIPIPPYLNRESEAIDEKRYQTLYARIRGSVAAPTAGLHFTDSALNSIAEKGIEMERICLHVGAGTFLPVKSDVISNHTMHREPFSVPIGLLKKLAEGKRKTVAVGTTSIRTLESLYYAGVDCIEKGVPGDIAQWAPYSRDYAYSTEDALGAIVDYLERNSLEELRLGTKIIIVPGFRFRIADMMVTNFHQPESTLILLVSAFVGDHWREIYDYALSHEFRFLSYGDSSLLERA